ncbi:MAG: AarF/ABC1/UbiB kinase family protein [Deltaproteobacteria bacterium]|nr:AarF/ABC1/UbiB kinase family protein [Deltaproteobacteria bacterium]
MSDKPATGGKRFFKLAGMTASVASNYARSKVKSIFLDEDGTRKELSKLGELNGERIVETLGELKGAVMKVGQMASLAQDILPKEIGDALGKLQKEAPPMAYEVIAAQIEKEFGAAPETLFKSFSREPFAAASIGQVHRAVTDDGREVVVKIQYPGVDGAVDSDLNHLKLAFLASGLIRIEKKALNALVQELRERLHEELDYCNEADNVRHFRELFKDDDRVVIPEVIGERSSKRILTLTYEPGDHLQKLVSLGYSQEQRNQLGENLFGIFLDQLFRFHAIHADPNPANFGFRRDGKIVMYDFGCVKKIKPEIAQAYNDTVYAGLHEDYETVETGLQRLGVRNLKGATLPDGYYKMWRDIFGRPFFQEIYDYGRADIHKDVLKNTPLFLAKYASAFQPSPDIVFVDRVIGGHYGTLCHLRTQASFRKVLDTYLTAPSEP